MSTLFAKDGAIAMKLVDGRWVCSVCGAVVQLPRGRSAVELPVGPRADRRSILVDGAEVHRCALVPAARPR